MSDQQLPVVQVRQLTSSHEDTKGFFRLTRSDFVSVEIAPNSHYVAVCPDEETVDAPIVVTDGRAAVKDEPLGGPERTPID